MKKLAVLFLVLLLVLVAAVPVYAAPPVIETGYSTMTICRPITSYAQALRCGTTKY